MALSSPLGAIGVDISAWQRDIDYRALRKAGVEFAIIKAGHYYGRRDPLLVAHRDGCRAAGIRVGFYWYAYQACDPVQEARNFVAWSGRRDGEPMFLDAEEASLSPDWCARFVAEVDRLLPGDTRCHIYTYWSWLAERPQFDKVIGNRALWLAVYNSQHKVPTTRQGAPRGMRVAGHQFSSTMRVLGYAGGSLDVNLWYDGIEAFVRLGRSSTPAPPAPPVPAGRPVQTPHATAAPLKPGARGEHVKALQRALNKTFRAYSHLVVDGVYGTATTAVVAEFQRRAKAEGNYTGLVDGVAGPLTRAALRADGTNL